MGHRFLQKSVISQKINLSENNKHLFRVNALVDKHSARNEKGTRKSTAKSELVSSGHPH